jgi:hypothetical protein
MKPDVISWLLEGDPSIRWQVQRDLLHASPAKYELERKKIPKEGWGGCLIARTDGLGAAGCTPQIHSTTYTMPPCACLAAANPSKTRLQVISRSRLLHRRGINFFVCLEIANLRHGMIPLCWPTSATPTGNIVPLLHLANQQMSDGGWNCESYKGATHSSFHTTMLALEGLYEYQCTFPEKKKTITNSAVWTEFCY